MSAHRLRADRGADPTGTEPVPQQRSLRAYRGRYGEKVVEVMGDERATAGGHGGQRSTTVVSTVEDSGRPLTDLDLPELELDETIPPRPEEEIADLLRAERRV